MSLPLILALTIGASASAAPAQNGAVRVLVTRTIAVDAPNDAEALTAAIVIAARRFNELEVLGDTDIARMLDAEANKQVLGCQADLSCLSEIADAMNAPEMLSSQLTKTGSTWILTLTRLNRATMTAVARQQVLADGDSANVVLGGINDAVSRLYGHTAWSALVPVGGVVAGVGVATVGAGVGLYLAALADYEAGLAATANAERARRKASGEPLYIASLASWAVGATAVVVGGALVAVGLVQTFPDDEAGQ